MLINNLKFSFNGNDVLKNVTFSLNNNDKAGLVGVNGSGKSTLLKVLAGELEKNAGNIKINDQTIGYLKQEIMHNFDDYTIIEYIKHETEFDKLESRLQMLESNLTEENMDEYSEILNKFLAIDGYNFADNLKVVLNGLKFKGDYSSKIKTLSGGEKIKVLLAALLLKNCDVLLLDEPTNNLDFEAIMWLEKNLKNSNKKMLIVSHDEEFLNNITNKIFELDNGEITEYNLKYNDYLKEKANEYARKLEKYTKAKEEIEKLKGQVNKAKEWANKGTSKKAHNDNDKIANNFAKERTNSSNVSKLTRMLEKVEVPDFEAKKDINFFFEVDQSKGKKDILLNDLICGYESFSVPQINLSIPFGTRLQISGGNGSGKTTLIKTILGQIEPLAGELILGSDVKIGYISQDTLNAKNDESIIQYLTKNINSEEASLVFTLLDKMSMKYEDKDRLYKTLSPGERTRVNLIKIALEKINVLILDEVTNHLDKEALDLIYELVSNYTGTIISISHNRKYNELLEADIIVNVETGIVDYRTLPTRKRT